MELHQYLHVIILVQCITNTFMFIYKPRKVNEYYSILSININY